MGSHARLRLQEWSVYFLLCPEIQAYGYQIRFLADPSATFTKALDLDFDAPAIFGGPRSKRYALVVEGGKVKEAHVESDNTGLNGEKHAIWSRDANHE